MRGATHRTKLAIAIVSLVLAGCRASTQSPTATPEVIPLYFATTQTTAPTLHHLANAYNQDNKFIAIVEQIETMPTQEAYLEIPINDTREEVPYWLTTYLPQGDWWAAPIGQDGIAVIVHAELHLPGLTAGDLRRIFSGEVPNWSSFINQRQPITVVSMVEGDATRSAFQDLVLGQRQITLNALLAPSETAMIDIVAQTPGAIGFVSMTLISDQVQVVPVAASPDDMLVLPSRETIANELYPLRVPLLIIGENPPIPGDGYYEFILWAQQADGQRIISERYAPLPSQ
jgi:hypothetical protein